MDDNDKEMQRWLAQQKKLEEQLSGEKPDSIPMESWLALQRAAADRAKRLTLERQEDRRKGRRRRRRQERERREREKEAGGDGEGTGSGSSHRKRRDSDSSSSLRTSGRRSAKPALPGTEESSGNGGGGDRALNVSSGGSGGKRRSRSASYSSPRSTSGSRTGSRTGSPRLPPDAERVTDDAGTSGGPGGSGELCGGCGEPVEGAHLNALGRKFHMDHFTCQVCKESLVGKKFVASKSGRSITCLDCNRQGKKPDGAAHDDGGGPGGSVLPAPATAALEGLKAGVRTSGRLPAAVTDSPKVLPRVLEAADAAGDGTAPAASSSSGSHLLQKPFSAGTGGSAIRGSKEMMCGGCHKIIEKGRYLRTNNVRWHSECFVCSDCGKYVGDADVGFKEKDGKIFCKQHYAEKFCERCASCGEPITDSHFSKAMGKSFHKNHFCCAQCKKPIPAGYVSDAEQNPFCDNDCYAKFQE